MLKVGEVKEIYEMKGAGRSVRGIAGELGIARNTVRRYLKSPEAIRAKPRPQRASKLGPFTGTPTTDTSTVASTKGWRTAWCCTGS